MITRYILSAIFLTIPFYIMNRFHLMWDPVFLILVFLIFTNKNNVLPLIGIIVCIICDHLSVGSSGFFTISGFIIIGSAVWLRESFPFARKPLALIMIPVYSQFLWFMLLFGYYIGEGTGCEGVGYFAPFLIGNTLIAICLSIVFFGLLAKNKKSGLSPDLLRR